MTPPPQTGRRTTPLEAGERAALLKKRHPDQQRDQFATDPNPDIRELGQVALRREEVNDYFALGDLCANRVRTDDGRLLIFYVGKVLIAYQRAENLADNDRDRMLSRRIIDDFNDWLLEEAKKNPTRRNLAVALWAAAEGQDDLVEDPTGLTLDALLSGEFIALGKSASDAHTKAHADASLLLSDVSATVLAEENEVLMSSDSFLEDVSAMTQYEAQPQEGLSPTKQRAPMAHRPPVQSEPGEFGVGDRLDGRYEVADVRRGGMGVVYLCYDHEQKLPVAIKSFQGRFLDNERAVARFVQEAVTWIQLEKHRHIVQAKLVQNIAGRPHIILEHISGPEGLEPDLRSWIDHKRMSLAQSLEFGLHIALGLQHAAQRVPGLVHRDLKPANILVTHDGIAKVTDFGLVRSIDFSDQTLPEIERDQALRPEDRLTRVGAVVGTAPYMSPEQCQAQDVDQRADIYAFGCVLYEMICGRPVFQVRKFDAWLHAHVYEQPLFDELYETTLPPELKQLILGCLEKKPGDRPV
ncbi:MAG: serine/threonine protein kinase, partial [Anaerolineae bacterium]|nr:serine/threonine protein kinase [Anaerolineae bacterium]